MAVYGGIALHQREALLVDALARETETLGRALQITADNALRDGRSADLGRVLGRVAEDPETYAAAVVRSDGAVLAGGPTAALSCLESYVPLAEHVGEVRGWANCDGRVRWVALGLREPGAAILVARRATVLERDFAASRWRMLLTTIILAAATALAILLVLRRTLSRPLADVMRGVRALGGSDPPSPVAVDPSAGEIGALATAFNEMADRLEDKRQALVRESEERIALERRLRRSEKFAALGRLTGGLAHELGSPLNVIGVRAEAVAADPEAPEHVRRQAKEILGEVERVAGVITDLSRITRTRRIEPHPVDVAEVVRGIAEELGPDAAGAASLIGVEGLERPVIVMGDATLLRHAFLNLATNALRSVGEGTTGSAPPRVRMRVDENREWVRVVVEDNGRGIAEEDLSRILEPFFTKRDVGEGMGLGLPITLAIVEEHGGELDVRNAPGGGVTATVTLPTPGPGGGGTT